MRVHARLQRTAIQDHVLKQEFTAQAGVSNPVGRVFFNGQLPSKPAKWGAEEKDSSIYDFNTYDEGQGGIRLLIVNGFDGIDFWLVGKKGQGEKIFDYKSARKTGPHTLMMHGNSVEADKAHDVLVEHTNGLIEECLQFR
jgi:hypothetical protein